jgi:nucleotide-binding universal stress UspA family protein
MTTFESRRAAVDAQRTVAARRTATSRHEVALQKYLAATTYLTPDSPETPPRAAPTRPSGDRRSADLVIAGVEGSRCALDAASWAAAEAQRRGGTLLLVHAYVLPPIGYSTSNPYPPNAVDDLRAAGCAVLADTESELQRSYPDLPISTRMVYGDPGKVLAKASVSAALTVVGAHGRNRVGLALGSVASHLAHEHPAPVAVIRTGTWRARGPVVVGVDGSAGSAAALEFAFAAAALRNAPVMAVRCCQVPVHGLPPRDDEAGAAAAPRVLSEERLLQDWLAPYRAEHPEVPVEAVVLEERPTPALLRQSQNAQVVIVGSRGNSRLTEVLLGSTGQALVARSSAPVVIVPTPSS